MQLASNVDPTPDPTRRTSSTDFSGGIAGPRTRAARLTMAAIDVVAVIFALWCAAALRLDLSVSIADFFTRFTGGTTAQIVLALATGYVVGTYDLEPRMRRLNTCLRVIAAVLCSVAIASMIYYWAPWWKLWRSVQVYYFLFATIFLTGWRLIAWNWLSRTVPLIRCVLIGTPDDWQYAAELEKHPWIRFVVARKLAEEQLARENDALHAICSAAGATDVVTGKSISATLVPQLLFCKARGINVHRLVSIYMSATGRIPVEYIRPDEIAFGPSFSLRTSRLSRAVHRTIDLVASSVLLIISFPFHLLAALAVLIESGRPIYYVQKRVGQDEKEFPLLKVRTMIHDAEPSDPQWSSASDPRVTVVGRFLRRTRLDELPQLINVLRGDMSLIGPRPERRFFVDQLASSIPYYSLRHSVRPGLTGWAQVNHGYGSSAEDAMHKLQYDLYYIRESSFLLDCAILLRTVRTVILHPGS